MNKLVVANWKQNKNLAEVKEWLLTFSSLIEESSVNNVDVVICPPHPYLETVSDFAKNYDWIFVGAQDVSKHERGSHTGELGASQAADFVDYAIVGHSERSETTEVTLEKAKRCIEESIIPIICFKDPAELRVYKEIAGYFLWEDPATISKGGEFRPKPVEKIQEGILEIAGNYPIGRGILYGGSINKENASGLGKAPKLSGGVSGSASLDPEHFYKIIRSFESINALR